MKITDFIPGSHVLLGDSIENSTHLIYLGIDNDGYINCAFAEDCESGGAGEVMVLLLEQWEDGWRAYKCNTESHQIFFTSVRHIGGMSKCIVSILEQSPYAYLNLEWDTLLHYAFTYEKALLGMFDSLLSLTDLPTLFKKP